MNFTIAAKGSRYRTLTRIPADLAGQGGDIVEIMGNGDIAAGPLHLTLRMRNHRPGLARALDGAGALLALPAG